jgi:hypothetical protein
MRVVAVRCIAAILIVTLGGGGVALREAWGQTPSTPSSAPGTFLPTIFFRHDQSKTLEDINAHLRQTGFYPPTGGKLDIDLILNDAGAHSAIIEGKFAWFENLDCDSTIKKANQTLAKACSDFGRLSLDGTAIGVAFCCPSYTRPSAVNDLRRQIQESLHAFRRCEHDALAYCFPEHSITVAGAFYRNITCPGVVALFRLYEPRHADA